jgi:hypothetical protein
VRWPFADSTAILCGFAFSATGTSRSCAARSPMSAIADDAADRRPISLRKIK